MKYILGMETSCDETSAAVVRVGDNGQMEIAANIVASQIETHRLYGGVVPEIASRAHIETVSGITREALGTAGITPRDLTAVAVTAYPGLIGALLVGVNFAKSFAYANGLPLVAVDHIKAHVAAAYLFDKDLTPPFLAVVVSGGHTALYDVAGYTDFHLIGSTRDDAAGEAFDKIGRVIGLPYPAGAALDQLAREGNPKAVLLPSPALSGDTLDLSFSGLKTAALNFIHHCEQTGEPVPRADVAAALTAAVTTGITQKTAAALQKTGRKVVVLAGGVAANSHLRAGMEKTARAGGARLSVPPLSLCGDNGAMVATAGYFEYLDGRLADVSLNASAEDNP